MKNIDFHLHTKYSKCSNLEPSTIIKLCKKRDIQGFMVCDHDTIKGILAMKSCLSSDDELLFIPGIEISTNFGEVIGAWLEVLPAKNDFYDVVNHIKDHDGLILIPHPYDKFRPKSFQLDDQFVEHIDAIEVFNSRCILPMGNKRALQFAKTHSLIQTAGSDAHFSVELGRAWTSFK